MNFYVSVFKDSHIVSIQRQGQNGPVFSGTIELAGQRLLVLNGGPQYRFTEAISLFVDCEDQAEVDDLWKKLSAGGEVQQCGWLKDKFGLSGRSSRRCHAADVIPDPAAQRVMQV
jgi:predicted 3-demethylubiquinone-9 3-methyltransferase (glyoxalase superfamily)